MPYVKEWLQSKRLRRQARQWMEANGRERTAARCLFYLNRTARFFSVERPVVYDYKTELIRYWYEQGFCRKVYLQKQIKECWSCTDGVHWTGYDCNRCDGTGIYSYHTLFCFAFEFDGRYYSWHQPWQVMKAVGWEVPIPDEEPTKYREAPAIYDNPYAVVQGEAWMLYLAVLHEYLLDLGIEVESRFFPTFWKALKNGLESFWLWEVYDWTQEVISDLSRGMAWIVTGKLPEKAEPDPEDEIPF